MIFANADFLWPFGKINLHLRHIKRGSELQMLKFKYALLAAALVTGTTATAVQIQQTPTYSPSVMIGVTFAFGGGTSGIGFSARVLSSNEPNKALIAGGVTYYPWAQNHFGVDLGAGMITNSFVGTVGYDFLQNAPVFSLGGTKTAVAPQD